MLSKALRLRRFRGYAHQSGMLTDSWDIGRTLRAISNQLRDLERFGAHASCPFDLLLPLSDCKGKLCELM